MRPWVLSSRPAVSRSRQRSRPLVIGWPPASRHSPLAADARGLFDEAQHTAAAGKARMKRELCEVRELAIPYQEVRALLAPNPIRFPIPARRHLLGRIVHQCSQYVFVFTYRFDLRCVTLSKGFRIIGGGFVTSAGGTVTARRQSGTELGASAK